MRWLPEGTSVSGSQQLKRAHWFDTRTSLDQKYYAPNLSSWSTDATNLLSVTALNNAISCPLNGLSIYKPQYVVSNLTGEMSQFFTSKVLPDGSSIWALDWQHVNLSRPDNWNGDRHQLGFPSELDSVHGGWSKKYRNFGTTNPRSRYQRDCVVDNYGMGSSDRNRAGFFKYLSNVQTEEYQEDILEHRDKNITVNLDASNTFSQKVTLGEAFSTQTVDTAGEGFRKATDGFIDPGSRWSSSTDEENTWLRTMFLSVGPSITEKPVAKGLYIWMHRSSERWSKLRIHARKDGGHWLKLADEITLPSVPDATPIFIPLSGADAYDYKHFSVVALGSNGSNWTSVAEIRYSSTTEPDSSAVIVDPSPVLPHPEIGNSFKFANGFNYDPEGQTNAPDLSIDGSIETLNYWAFEGTGSLEVSLDTPKLISAINLWMHRSSERSSIINVVSYDAFGLYELDIDSYNIPITPNNQATRIEFDEPVLTSRIELQFNGNTVNDWNSVSEVSWE